VKRAERAAQQRAHFARDPLTHTYERLREIDCEIGVVLSCQRFRRLSLGETQEHVRELLDLIRPMLAQVAP
jgi:hypothetical protein